MAIRKKVGLALGSGGVRGLAHVGVIKTLLKHDIPIDYIAGCSIGAWVGAHYALYQDINLLEEFTVGKKKEKIFSFLEPTLRGGLVKGRKIEKLLNTWLGDADFKDLKIPLNIVAADLLSGEQVIFGSGKLSFAARASMAIPGLFQPIRYKDKILVDGGICNPVPDDLVRKMGADVVIAVNLDSFQGSNGFSKKNLNFYSIALRTMFLMRDYLAKYSMKDYDVAIQPMLAKYSSWVGYFTGDVGQKIVAIGEKETEKMIPLIKEKLN